MNGEGLRLAGPDRSVPLSCRLQFLFGGTLTQFGWFWLGFSMIHARIFGMGVAPDVPLPGRVVVFAFPLIGLGLLWGGTLRGLRGIRLLRRGIVTTGRLTGKSRTNVEVNERPVYELRYDFTTVSGTKAVAVARSHEPAVLEDEAEEPLVYDPAEPAHAVVLDELPGRPRLDDDSVTRTEGGFLRLLIIPGAALLGHGAWLAIDLLR